MNSFRRTTRNRSKNTSVYLKHEVDKWRQSCEKKQRYNKFNFEGSDQDDNEADNDDVDKWDDDFKEETLQNKDSMGEIDLVELTRKQMLILSTLVPNEILNMEKFSSEDSKRFVGVLLMADVSGFTALSEKYNNTGKSGTYRLTATLNAYLGALIELIYEHGGDVLKFAGDAFLALWKNNKHVFISHTIHDVIACALAIQHSYSTYETDVKVNLRVKLAISAGNLLFAPIGEGADLNFVIYGLPVLEAKTAESVCVSGEVTVSPTAWGHCYTRNYSHVVREDGHVVIKAILYDPHEKDVTKPYNGLMAVKTVRTNFGAFENLPESFWDITQNLNLQESFKNKEFINTRKTLLAVENKPIVPEIRKFMVLPVLTQVDAHQPLEYLTEMRQVSILFITLKPFKCPILQFVTIVNNAYKVTSTIVYRSMGCVNKIVLFDKDIMMLVVFGLRGFKHESEAQAALKCAFNVKKSLSNLHGIQEVSLGVTTGPVYCGVVGHPLRREYTVIGATVNKAARLMCYYRNKITCDESTYIQSKISSNSFSLQPHIDLKGIEYAGKIYEYTEDIRLKHINDIPIMPPLLNRIEELQIFRQWLSKTSQSPRKYDALMFVGKSRMGKTMLLEWMSREAKNSGLNVCYINLTTIHSATTYLGLNKIVDSLLKISQPIKEFEKEEKIVRMLNSHHDSLCLLNPIIKVRFAFTENIKVHNEDKLTQRTKKIFSLLIKSISENNVIFLDNIDNLHPVTWEFISILMQSKNIFSVFTSTRKKYSTKQSWLYDVFRNDKIKKIGLGPLDNNWIPPLACQILGVDMVSHELCHAIQEKTKNVPGAVEVFLIQLFSSGAIEKQNVIENESETFYNMLSPRRTLLQPRSIHLKDQEKLNGFLENEVKTGPTLCIVNKEANLMIDLENQETNAAIMILIDSLTPYQQLLLKIASVIGSVFSRILLESTMYANNPSKTAKSIKRLFNLRILTCANVLTNGKNHMDKPVDSTMNLMCNCNFEIEEDEILPKYAFCKVLKFRSKSARKTCYELLPLNQKNEFHSRVLSYLESNKQNCIACHGSLLIVYPNILESIRYKSLVQISDDSIASQNIYELQPITPESATSYTYLHDNHSSNEYSTNISSGGLHEKSERRQSNKIKLKKKVILRSNTSLNKIIDTTVETLSLKTSVIQANNTIEEHCGSVTEILEAEMEDWNNLRIFEIDEQYIHQTKDKNQNKILSIKLEERFSEVNFEDCSCWELNLALYEQLIYHAIQSEMWHKVVLFQIEYCYFSLKINDTNGVQDILDEALKLCLDKHTNLTKSNRKIYKAKIFSLRAKFYLLTGNNSLAHAEIEKAFKIYRIDIMNLYNFSKLILLPFKSIQSASNSKNNSFECDSIKCLNTASILYLGMGDERLAYLCAQLGAKHAQKKHCCIDEISNAFSTALQIELCRGNILRINKLTNKVIRMFKNLPNPIPCVDLYAVVNLIGFCFRAKIAIGEIPTIIPMGYKAFVLSKEINAQSVILEITPELFYLLLSGGHLKNAIKVLEEFLAIAKTMTELEYDTWYYAMCIDLILDAGIQYEKPPEINRFHENMIGKNDKTSACRRLTLGLWTYWLRYGSDGRVKLIETQALSWMNNEDVIGTLTNILSSLRLAEGMLEMLAHKMRDLQKVVDMMQLKSLADKLLDNIESDIRLCKLVHPRWLLLRSISHKLSRRNNQAALEITQALEEAKKYNNVMERAILQATISSVPNARSAWTENAKHDHFISWQEGIDKVKSDWSTIVYNYSTNYIL